MSKKESFSPTESELLSPTEAVKFLQSLGVSFTEGTMAVWRCRKEGPEYRKVRNRVYYTRPCLKAFIQGEKVITTDSVVL